MFNYFILGIFVYIFCIPIVKQLAQTIVTYLKVLEILGASKIAKIQENLDAEEKEIQPIGFYMPIGEEEDDEEIL